MTGANPPRYVRPGRVGGWFNAVVAGLARVGVGLYGARVLRVRGRRTGEWREVPVNPLTHGGVRYLVSPRGHTQWVRNLRVAGGGELRIGRRTEAFTAAEVADADKPDLLRAYLRRWKWEVGTFFGGVGPDAPTEDLLRIAPDHPVFRLQPGER